MTLIANADFLKVTGKLAGIYDLLTTGLGTAAGGAAVGNAQNLLSKLNADVAALNDLQQELDLATGVIADQAACTAEAFFSAKLNGFWQGLQSHMQVRGKLVDASIKDIQTYLTYYNTTTGGALYQCLVTPSFNAVYAAFKGGKYLASGLVMSPGINPANGQANGMGLGTYASVYTAGAAVTQDATAGNLSYAGVSLIAEVAVAFLNATADPVVTVTGLADDGSGSTTWTGTLTMGSHNAAIAISQQTISSGAITGQTRATVTVGSTTGIVPGSLVYINKSAADQELVLVEAVPSGTTFTAVFLKSHASSATVDGTNSVVLTNGGSKRCKSVTNVVAPAASSTAGTVRILGVEDRKPTPA